MIVVVHELDDRKDTSGALNQDDLIDVSLVDFGIFLASKRVL